ERGMPWGPSLHSKRPHASPVDRCVACLHGPPQGREPVDPNPTSPAIVGAVRFGNDMPLSLVAGPCALESKVHALEMATALKEIAARAVVRFVYKTSLHHTNRSL